MKIFLETLFSFFPFILFNAFALEVDPDNPCYDVTWSYSSVSGKCYKAGSRSDMLSWDDAQQACEHLLVPKSFVNVHLLELNTGRAEMIAAAKLMLTAGFLAQVWTGARRLPGSSDFVWTSRNETANFNYIAWSGGAGPGGCIAFKFRTEYSTISSRWNMTFEVENIDCSQPNSYYCEHEVPRCIDPPGNFNTSTMFFAPQQPFPGARVTAVCQPGKFISHAVDAEFVNGPLVNQSLTRGTYYCTGKRASSGAADPLKFTTLFQYSGYNMSECQTIRCLLYPHLLEHVVKKPIPDAGKEYIIRNYEDVVPLECVQGYVNYENQSTRKTSMVCRQDDLSLAKGIWQPANYQACVAVRCSAAELQDMKPHNGVLSSARNHQSEKTYGSQQINEFNQYGNVISIRCSPGFLYPDRSTEKQVLCSLANNTFDRGQYYGYLGTVLPIPSSCVATTCVYEEAMIQEAYRMEPYFLVNNATDTWKNLTKHDGLVYALHAELRFFCAKGYESVSQQNNFSIGCGLTGKWIPQMTGCIEKVKEIPLKVDGRFDSEKTEAESAKQISSIMFIVTVVFLVFILLLDLTTAPRDVKFLSKNIKLQKKRYRSLKQRSMTHQ
ncbi:unnamed protein product [Dicrocoelium dendriticum]|nr:unnamed protein product [Dicrocoelium dendriticum]